MIKTAAIKSKHPAFQKHNHPNKTAICGRSYSGARPEMFSQYTGKLDTLMILFSELPSDKLLLVIPYTEKFPSEIQILYNAN